MLTGIGIEQLVSGGASGVVAVIAYTAVKALAARRSGNGNGKGLPCREHGEAISRLTEQARNTERWLRSISEKLDLIVPKSDG